MTEVYYITKKPIHVKNTMYILLPKAWGFEGGELVKMDIMTLDGSVHREDIVRIVGNKTSVSPRVTIRQVLGMPECELYTIAIRRTEDDGGDGPQEAD